MGERGYGGIGMWGVWGYRYVGGMGDWGYRYVGERGYGGIGIRGVGCKFRIQTVHIVQPTARSSVLCV